MDTARAQERSSSHKKRARVKKHKEKDVLTKEIVQAKRGHVPRYRFLTFLIHSPTTFFISKPTSVTLATDNMNDEKIPSIL